MCLVWDWWWLGRCYREQAHSYRGLWLGWDGVFASRLAPTGECGSGVMSLDAEYEAGGFAWNVVEIAEALHADLFQDAD
jgi:hypothetical protein